MRDNLGDVEIDLVAGTYTYNGQTNVMSGFTGPVAVGDANQSITGSDLGESFRLDLGRDTIHAGGGCDFVTILYLGGDSLDGGDGRDYLSVSFRGATPVDSVRFDMRSGEINDSSAINFEAYFGGFGVTVDQTIFGTMDANRIQTGGGDDVIDSVGGGSVADRAFNVMVGLSGSDTYIARGMNEVMRDAQNGDGNADTFIIKSVSSPDARQVSIVGYQKADGDVIDLTDLGVTRAEIEAGHVELGNGQDAVILGDLTLNLASFDTTLDDFVFLLA